MKTNDFQKEKDEIKNLHAEIEKLCAPILKKIDKLQSKVAKCQHPISHILQGKYKPDDGTYFDNCEPEFRVCTICGYAEEGWGCGFQKLGYQIYGSEIKEVERHIAEKYVKKMHYQSNIREWGNF